MFQLKQIILLVLFVSKSKSYLVNENKIWTSACAIANCLPSLNACFNCYGEAQCRQCIKLNNPDCSSCADAIFDKASLNLINGLQYMSCDLSDPIQSCHIYCRGTYKGTGTCNLIQNTPVCECSFNQPTFPSTLTSLLSTSTPPSSIFNGNILHRMNGDKSTRNILLALPNGDLASGTSYGMIHIWDTKTGIIKRNLSVSTHNVWGISLLSNGNIVSGTFYDMNINITIWDLTQNNPFVKTFQIAENPFCLYGLPNDDFVSGFDNLRNIVIRDIKTGNIKKVLVGHSNQVSKVALLSNGNLASSSLDGTIKIWNLSDGSIIHSFDDGSISWMSNLAILNNGYIASTGRNNEINIRNPNNGQFIQKLTGHNSSIFDLKILKDGSLVSSSKDKSIKIWNPNNGLLIKTLLGHSSEVMYLDVLDNGNLASESRGEIFVWS